MYMPEKSSQQDEESAINFYTNKHESPNPNTMIIQLPLPPQHVADSGGATTSSGGDDPTTAAVTFTATRTSSNPSSSAAPKKRAETWIQEEIRSLISLRKEIDSMFNTSKSNKHLWDEISLKMRERGFDRSPTMCTDKWRNLLKEYKKAKQNNQEGNGSGSAKMNYYKDIEEILRDRNKNGPSWKNPGSSNGVDGGSCSKVDSFMQFADKGIDDANITFGPVEANGRSTLNLERRLDHDGHPLAITAADAVGANGVSPWNWRGPPENAGEHTNSTYDGRVITVKLGDYTKRIGIDGTADAIKEAIKSAFGLRTKRAFWLEDEDEVVRSLDKAMPLGNYILHVDEGLTIKVCYYEESEHLHAEDKTFYTEGDFCEFLSRRGWTCLREYNGFRIVDSMDELCPGAIYRGVNEGRL